MTDAQCLAEFAEGRSSNAFAAIVSRHIDLVYGTARRIVGDRHLAEDVAQAAFILLAKKAPKVNPATLPGWLVNTTRLVAREALRAKLGREKKESETARMRSEVQSRSNDATAEEIAPFLDEALSRLNESDRSAVVMRFLQGRKFADVGMAMGISEEAARKRVDRAVEKLRLIFMKQGFGLSAGGTMLILASQASQAPSGLTGLISATAIEGGNGSSIALATAVLSATKLKTTLAAMALFAFVVVVGGIGIHTVLSTTTHPSLGATQAGEAKDSSGIAIQVADPDGKAFKGALLGNHADWSEAGVDGKNQPPTPDITFSGPRERIVSDEQGKAIVTTEQLFDGGNYATLYAFDADSHLVAIAVARATTGLTEVRLDLQPACRVFGTVTWPGMDDKIDLTHVDVSLGRSEMQICCNSKHRRFEIVLPPGNYVLNAFGQLGDKLVTGMTHAKIVIPPKTRELHCDVQLTTPGNNFEQ